MNNADRKSNISRYKYICALQDSNLKRELYYAFEAQAVYSKCLRI